MPAKPDTGSQPTTPTTPTTPAKPDSDSRPTTPTTPTTPAKPDHGNASISGQAGYKPGNKVDNGSQAVNNNTTSETSASQNNSHVSVSDTSATMTREAYKAQKASLPQTGNENSKAVVALGVLAGMFGLGIAAKDKKEF